MSVQTVNIKGMFEEIGAVNRKYGVPKTMGFIPDRLEIVLERKGDRFNLSYTEFFNYLPPEVLEAAKENALQLIQQLGVPQKITRLERGVGVQMDGDLRVVLFVMMELLLQNKNIQADLEPVLDALRTNVQTWFDFSDIHWDWKEETENKYKEFIATLERVVQEQPSYESEINAVVKKYAPQPRKAKE